MQSIETLLTLSEMEQAATRGSGFRTFKEAASSVLRSGDLLPRQKLRELASVAVMTLPSYALSDQARRALSGGLISTFFRGQVPYQPHYVAPDYGLLLRQGSEVFELEPAQDLHDATAALLTVYQHLPSSWVGPAFIGRLDLLLEPYLDTVSPGEARRTMRSFWLLSDRLFGSSWVHGNLGPNETRTGHMLLELDRELRTSTNVSFLYDPETTPRAFALKAVRSALSITKPYFVNHPLYAGEWGPDYGIVACYCPVSLAGGVYSLVRLNLKQLVALSNGTLEDVLDHLIPFAAEIMMEITNSEAGFLVEEVKWFDNSVFVKEGLVRRERFTSYAAFYGLAEAVNSLMAEKGRPEARYGHDEEANEMARLILERLAEELARIPACYCESSAGRVRFHSQAGIASDKGVTPGHRICSGDEPGLYNHLRAELPAHHLCAGGCTSILEFDQTAEGNPEAILDIIRGAFKNGARMLSIGSAHSEFVRVTGYLVRRADLEGAKAEKALLYDSAHWASETFDNRPHDLHRRVCQV